MIMGSPKSKSKQTLVTKPQPRRSSSDREINYNTPPSPPKEGARYLLERSKETSNKQVPPKLFMTGSIGDIEEWVSLGFENSRCTSIALFTCDYSEGSYECEEVKVDVDKLSPDLLERPNTPFRRSIGVSRTYLVHSNHILSSQLDIPFPCLDLGSYASGVLGTSFQGTSPRLFSPDEGLGAIETCLAMIDRRLIEFSRGKGSAYLGRRASRDNANVTESKIRGPHGNPESKIRGPLGDPETLSIRLGKLFCNLHAKVSGHKFPY
jgi:hypothetical protein